MEYHFIGLVNVVIFLLCLVGIWTQLRLIEWRKGLFAEGGLAGEKPTDILSLNQFGSSFLAFFSFFVYGFVIERFNHYLVWPRLLATLLTLAILYQIMIDRREARTVAVFSACSGATLAALFFLAAGAKVSRGGRAFTQGLVLVSAVIVAQGYAHQLAVIRRTGRSGGVSLRMHQLTLLKDVSTMMLGVAMGLKTGWPLLLTNGLCALTKLGVMWQIRWARLSPLALQRREKASGRAEAKWVEAQFGG